MARVTGKLEVRLPRGLAEGLGLRPGDEVTWRPAGVGLRLEPRPAERPFDRATRLALFDRATARLEERFREPPGDGVEEEVDGRVEERIEEGIEAEAEPSPGSRWPP